MQNDNNKRDSIEIIETVQVSLQRRSTWKFTITVIKQILYHKTKKKTLDNLCEKFALEKTTWQSRWEVQIGSSNPVSSTSDSFRVPPTRTNCCRRKSFMDMEPYGVWLIMLTILVMSRQIWKYMVDVCLSVRDISFNDISVTSLRWFILKRVPESHNEY